MFQRTRCDMHVRMLCYLVLPVQYQNQVSDRDRSGSGSARFDSCRRFVQSEL
jgi:hypothetical protein